jgi:hypothetical protein
VDSAVKAKQADQRAAQAAEEKVRMIYLGESC